MSRLIPLIIILAAGSLEASSFITVRLDDPMSVYLTDKAFDAHGDGMADDTNAIQQAIDTLQQTRRCGIVFVPEGRYRLTRTVYIWPGIRLIGYGKNRPVFVLGNNTPGYQDREHEKVMIFFAGARPQTAQDKPPDANPGTFYSAMANIDIQIGDGNPGAVAVRGTYAQHCFVAHMDIHTGSGLAGVHDTGNVMEDVRFYGGDYGIWTHTPSPSWQFTAVDTYFEGQRVAAIRDNTACMTLIRPHFRDVPTAISIDEGSPDNLYVKDGRMERISGPAVVIGIYGLPRNQVNLEDVVCQDVPVFATFREGNRDFTVPNQTYLVKVFSHGLHYSDLADQGQIKDIFQMVPLDTMPQPVPSDLPTLPPCQSWVNIRTLGAKGDGQTDDTSIFRQAIADYRAIYLPCGFYLISDTITLRPDTVLIGLHPAMTQILLRDRSPAFAGVGNPKPIIEAPQGGSNILIGIGIYTNGINPRAVGVKWMAGKNSMINDVRFLGGHGTYRPDGTREEPYNNNHTADPDINRRWDSQYPSLWVNNGGGTFFDIWTPSTFSQAGMLISDTSTEGRIYHISSEHHVRYEIQMRNVSNWLIYSLQTEAERGESGLASALEMDNCHDITVANTHIYRVISSFQPFPYAIRLANCSNIRFRNMHCYSNSKVCYDTTILDQTNNLQLRQREFAWLDVTGKPTNKQGQTPSLILEPGTKVERLADGFFNISGGAVHPSGDLFFVDARWHRIYRWSQQHRMVSVVRDNPLGPVNLAIDNSGNVMVVSYEGKGVVYAFNPDANGMEIKLIEPVPVAPRPRMKVFLPVGDWSIQGSSGSQARPVKRTYHYISPDGTCLIAAGDDLVHGKTSWGVKSADLLRCFGLGAVNPGERFYYPTEWQTMTYVGTVGPDGDFIEFRPLLRRGGESAAVDEKGNIYLADGQVYVYEPSGRLVEVIEIPQRPIQLIFGGHDRRTLFICARTALYAARTRFRARQ